MRSGVPDWMNAVAAMLAAGSGRGGCLVRFPEYRPDLAKALAHHLDLEFFDFWAEVMSRLGTSAHTLGLDAIGQSLKARAAHRGWGEIGDVSPLVRLGSSRSGLQPDPGSKDPAPDRSAIPGSAFEFFGVGSPRTANDRSWPLADTRRGGRTQVSGPASRRSHYSGQQRFRPKTKHHSGRAMGSLAYAVTGIKPSLLNVDCIFEYGLKLQNCGDAGSGHIHGPDNPAIHFLNGYGRWLNDASRTPPLGRSMRGEEGQPRQNTPACLMQWPSWITADSRPGGSR